MSDALIVSSTAATTLKTNEQWREYIAEASVKELSAIVEKGKRIAEFHAFHFAESPSTRGNWDVRCPEVTGLSHMSCARYIAVYQMFVNPDYHQFIANTKGRLPLDVTSLYNIAQAIESDKDTVSEAFANNTLKLDVTREVMGVKNL